MSAVAVAVVGTAVAAPAVAMPGRASAASGVLDAGAANGPVTVVRDGVSSDVTQLALTLTLTPARPQVLHALATTPAASMPRATRATLLDQAAPEPVTRARVIAALRASGFAVTAQDEWTVQVAGPRDAVERTFGVHMRADAAGIHPDRPLRVPAALAGAVTAVVGADTRVLSRPHSAAVAHQPAWAGGRLTSSAAGGKGTAAPQSVAGANAVPGTSPGQVKAAVGMSAPGADGHGLTVATLQFSGWNSTDMGAYAQADGVPMPSLTQISVDGADPTVPDSSGGQNEVALDQESILAQAPAARQRMYVAPTPGRGTWTRWT